MKRDIKQRMVNFIADFAQAEGYGPTYHEIRDACGLSSTSHVSYYLDQLTEEGRVTRIPRSPRTIRVVKGRALC